jgi:hypothetical protein
MSQEDAVRFLHEQGLPTGVIHRRLVDVFGDEAIGHAHDPATRLDDSRGVKGQTSELFY